MARLVADFGSTHGKDVSRMKEALRISKDIGVDVTKFQLFFGEEYTKNGNIEFPRDLWPEVYYFAKEIEQPVTCSVFDLTALMLMNKTPDLPFVKFAYSQRYKDDWMKASEHPVMVSCDDLSLSRMPKDAIKLLCVAEYPVNFQVSFEGVFPKFDGWSDHTRGVTQTIRAAQAGARFIEKHMKLDKEIGCPDEAFAITHKEMDQLVRAVK